MFMEQPVDPPEYCPECGAPLFRGRCQECIQDYEDDHYDDYDGSIGNVW